MWPSLLLLLMLAGLLLLIEFLHDWLRVQRYYRYVTPPRAHPRSPARCVARSGGGGESNGDIRLCQIVWISSMRWLAPCVDIDFNIIVVVVINAQRPLVAANGNHRRWEHGRLLQAVGGHR
jgi:hypothetical protein